MTPYYDEDGIKIYHGDCETVMSSSVARGSVALTVTSPPYDDIRDYEDGSDFHMEAVASELWRVTRPGGVVVWVVSDGVVNGAESGSSFRQCQALVDEGFQLHDTMIYLKKNPPPVGGATRYYQAFEFMFVLSKGAPGTFNPIKRPRINNWNDNRTERVRPMTRERDGTFHPKTVTMNEIVKATNVWMYAVGFGNSTSDAVAFEHPAVFPEQLVADHLHSWTNRGDLVLDPFMGSGTTLKGARLMGCSAVGIERSRRYCEIAIQRLAQGVLQFDWGVWVSVCRPTERGRNESFRFDV